jgi:hypothetical protein
VAILVCLALIASGCSKAVQIPSDQVDAAAREESGRYRIQMVDGSYYTVERFSLTDSTIVIEKLGPSDARYKRIALPIDVPLADVESVSKYELDHDRTFFALVGAGVVALAIAFVATFEFSAD